MNYYDQLEEELIKLFPKATSKQIEYAVDRIDKELENFPVGQILKVEDNKPMMLIRITFNVGYVVPDKINVCTQQVSFTYQLLKLPY
jgi:hypothetical protein